jgi:hypothetical protein
MKVVMPRGRENETLDAKFDVTPYGGCACSFDEVLDRWMTAAARNKGGSGKPCQCSCSYGTANRSANFSLGNNSSEW